MNRLPGAIYQRMRDGYVLVDIIYAHDALYSVNVRFYNHYLVDLPRRDNIVLFLDVSQRSGHRRQMWTDIHQIVERTAINQILIALRS